MSGHVGYDVVDVRFGENIGCYLGVMIFSIAWREMLRMMLCIKTVGIIIVCILNIISDCLENVADVLAIICRQMAQ